MPGTYRGPVETGLYYLQSRYYDTEICRFINADGYASTGQGLLSSNMFAYCENNPISFADPTGTSLVNNRVNIAEICGSSKKAQASQTLINGQQLSPYNDMKYAGSTVGYAGCESIAIYNMLRLIGKDVEFQDVINTMTKLFRIVPSTGWGRNGRWGASPQGIAYCIASYGVDYQFSYKQNRLNPDNSPGVYLISFWNKPGSIGTQVFSGYHTVAVSWDGNNYTAYNYDCYSDSTYSTTTGLDYYLEEKGGYFFGFFIPYQ